ncbi:MAG: hypothetical protein Kow0099_21530 [Candidatus Abyssubacteria bacterium]
MTMTRRVKVAGVGFLAGLLYLFVIPEFWPAPSIDVYVPERLSHAGNADFQVVVSAWHPNFALQSANILFDVEPARNSGVAFYHASLYASPETKVWPFWSVNRFTWPRRRMFELTLPMTELSEKGLLRNELTGTLSLVIEHVKPSDSNRMPLGGYLTKKVLKRETFRCEVTGP